MSHTRTKKVFDFWMKLQKHKQVLEQQLTETYTQKGAEAARLLIQGEIKALSLVIADMKEEFNFKGEG